MESVVDGVLNIMLLRTLCIEFVVSLLHLIWGLTPLLTLFFGPIATKARVVVDRLGSDIP